jgi:hypothetical protein
MITHILIATLIFSTIVLVARSLQERIYELEERHRKLSRRLLRLENSQWALEQSDLPFATTENFYETIKRQQELDLKP